MTSQSPIDDVQVGGLSTRAQSWLDRVRQEGETEVLWFARLLCADIEAKRWALESALDPDEKKAAALDLKAVSEARRAQMDIISRAADVEQRKTDDAQQAQAWRQMQAALDLRARAPMTTEARSLTRAEKRYAWEHSRTKPSKS